MSYDSDFALVVRTDYKGSYRDGFRLHREINLSFN